MGAPVVCRYSLFIYEEMLDFLKKCLYIVYTYLEDDVKTSIRKWGNGLGLLIPSVYSRELGISEASTVELRVVKSSLVIKPRPERKPELKKLLARINEGNLHAAVETGRAVGNEAW